MAVTQDLQNPISLPNGLDTANNNPIARADKIIRQGKGHDVETAITRLEAFTLNWNFDDGITGVDPGAGNVAFNNAAKASVTSLAFNVVSNTNSANFENLLMNLSSGDRLFIQEHNTPANNVLYRVTANPSTNGTLVTISVAEETNEGGEFTDAGQLDFAFLFTGSSGGGGGTSLPEDQQRWLSHTVEADVVTTTTTNIADGAVADSLIWRRAALVQQSEVSDPNVGVRLDEANRQSDGTFDRDSGTSVYSDDLANAYIYIGITNTDIASLTLSETYLEARRDGELVYSSALSGLVEDPLNVSQFKYFRTTNDEYHYIAGDTMEVVTRSSTTNQVYRYSNLLGDFTQNINNLPFTAVDDDFAARVSGTSDNQEITAADVIKLAGLLTTFSTSTGVPITGLYKEGGPSSDIADYTMIWNSSNPVLANFDSTRELSVMFDNNTTLTGVSGGGIIGERLEWVPRKYIYQVTLPAEISSGTPTSHLLTGDTTTYLPAGFNSNYKILRSNVDPGLLATIDAHGNSADLTTLESKVAALFPLTPDVNILTDWADIYAPEQAAQNVDIRNGYSLIADYRTSSDKYESAGVVYDDSGSGVVRYTGLTNNLHRSFGFRVPKISEVTLTGTSGTANINVDGTDYLATFNTNLTTTATDFVTSHATALDTEGITVTANAGVLTFTPNAGTTTFTISITNATGDLAGTIVDVVPNKTLLSIVDGSEIIPFVDITDAGNYRVNDFVPSQTGSEDITNQFHFLTRSGGSEILSPGVGNSQYLLTNFPASATNLDRVVQIGVDVLVNGVDTGAEHEADIDAPETNVDQAKQTFDASVFLGPLHGNRTVDVTIGYRFIVDGANLRMNLTLETAPSDVTVRFTNVVTILGYTAPTVVARVDRWSTLSGAGGAYTFTGENELLLSMQPRIGASGEYLGSIDVVPVVINSAGTINQLNDARIAQPDPLWAVVEVPDDQEFRTFAADHYLIHSDLASLIRDRNTKWAYALARLQDITVHAVTEPIDLAAGSTIDGVAIAPVGGSPEEIVYEALNKTAGANGLVSSVQLPADYTNFLYVHVTEYDMASLQWRHAEFPTYILSGGFVDTNDSVRLQGNTTMGWTSGTRTLTMGGNVKEIFRVSLKN